MKKNVSPFLAGMLTMALIGSLGMGALAATGQLTITVDPVNIQVNGQTFQPKDANGADVPVFSYNGTTYAPLRALAEAYGLDVGYDAAANMATVGAAATPVESSAPESAAPSALSDMKITDPEGNVITNYTLDAYKLRCGDTDIESTDGLPIIVESYQLHYISMQAITSAFNLLTPSADEVEELSSTVAGHKYLLLDSKIYLKIVDIADYFRLRVDVLPETSTIHFYQ